MNRARRRAVDRPPLAEPFKDSRCARIRPCCRDASAFSTKPACPPPKQSWQKQKRSRQNQQHDPDPPARGPSLRPSRVADRTLYALQENIHDSISLRWQSEQCALIVLNRSLVAVDHGRLKKVSRIHHKRNGRVRSDSPSLEFLGRRPDGGGGLVPRVELCEADEARNE